MEISLKCWAVAPTRVQGWGDEAPKRVGWDVGTARFPPHRVMGLGPTFCFVVLKWHILAILRCYP